MSDTAAPGTTPNPDPLLAAFHAATQAPYYRQLLAEQGLDPASIRTREVFHQRVPLTDKGKVFRPGRSALDLFRGGGLEAVAEISVSSGFSGAPSFGVGSAQEIELIQGAIDGALAELFGADEGRLLLVNGFGMGIQVRTRHCQSATGPRPDLMLAVTEAFSPQFDRTLILGDPHLLKQVVDDGNARNIDWQARQVSFLSGQDWLPETLRSYICRESGIDPDEPGSGRKYLQTMGLTELGLMLFIESELCVRIRRQAFRDPAVRTRLVGSETPATPSIFHYDPRRFHIESSPGDDGPRLVCTALSPGNPIPMVRYLTGDIGAPIDPSRIDELPASAHSAAALPLPFAWTSGRLGAVAAGAARVHTGRLRELLYSDIAVARQLTGNFLVSSNGTHPVVTIQLRPGVRPSVGVDATLESLAAMACIGQSPLPKVDVRGFGEYPSAPFLDYERKFRHSS